jgi:hypothetical protein
VKLRAGALVMGCLACLPAAHSAEEPVDPVLLEFLGSVDSEDKHWHEYLARTDIEQVAKQHRASHETSEPHADAPPPKEPPVNPQPSSSPPVNQK